MKKRALLFLLFLFALPFFSAAQITTVNAIIGDESFVKTFGRAPDAGDDDWLRIRTHLAYTEKILRERERNDLSPELQQKRLHLLDLLGDYVANGKFPENADHPEGRRPCFIDAKGTICAVGYLVEQTEGRDKAETINKDFQYATINEMHSEWLNGWLQRWGLSADEAATIQPAYPWREKRKPLHLPKKYTRSQTVYSAFQIMQPALLEGPPARDSVVLDLHVNKHYHTKESTVLSGDTALGLRILDRLEDQRFRPAYERRKVFKKRARMTPMSTYLQVFRRTVQLNDTADATLSYSTTQMTSMPEGMFGLVCNAIGKPTEVIHAYVSDDQGVIWQDTMRTNSQKLFRLPPAHGNLRVMYIVQGRKAIKGSSFDPAHFNNYTLWLQPITHDGYQTSNGQSLLTYHYYTWPKELFEGPKK